MHYNCRIITNTMPNKVEKMRTKIGNKNKKYKTNNQIGSEREQKKGPFLAGFSSLTIYQLSWLYWCCNGIFAQNRSPVVCIFCAVCKPFELENERRTFGEYVNLYNRTHKADADMPRATAKNSFIRSALVAFRHSKIIKIIRFDIFVERTCACASPNERFHGIVLWKMLGSSSSRQVYRNVCAFYLVLYAPKDISMPIQASAAAAAAIIQRNVSCVFAWTLVFLLIFHILTTHHATTYCY